MGVFLYSSIHQNETMVQFKGNYVVFFKKKNQNLALII